MLFIGWTAQQTSAIYSRADTAPTTVNEVAFANNDVTVYAAWGYDENSDGTADVLETYSLTYDLNGGNPGEGETYEPEEVMPGAVCKVKTAPYRSGYTFTGWKDEAGTAYQAGQKLVVDADLKLTAQWSSTGSSTDPSDPGKLGKPSHPESSTDSTSKTGDETNLALWITLLGISCIGVIVALLGTKRKYRGKHSKK